MDRLRPKLQYITEGGGSQIKERWCKKSEAQSNKQVRKEKQVKDFKGCVLPDCPGGGIPPVPLGNRTKMESTAALLPKQGSRAMGFGTDCGKKMGKEEKSIHHKALKSWWTHTIFKAVDNRGFTVTVLVCVSNMHRNTKNPPFYPVLRCNYWSAGTNCPPLQPSKSPTEHNFMTMPHVCSVGNEWLSSEDAWMEIWVGGALRSLQAVWHAWLSNTNISFLSATHPYVGDESPPPPPCKHCLDLLLMLASYNIYSFTSTEDMDMENATILPAYR